MNTTRLTATDVTWKGWRGLAVKAVTRSDHYWADKTPRRKAK